MGLLPRLSGANGPRPARAAKPRIRLRPEELKASLKLRPREKIGTFVMAAYMALVSTAVLVPDGLGRTERTQAAIAALMVVAVAVGTRFNSRFISIITFVACSLWPGWNNNGGKNYLFAYPFLAFVLYLTFAMSKARRDTTDARLVAGDFGDPAAERIAAKNRAQRATTDATGRDLATRSKRYTPPKKKPAAKSSSKSAAKR